MNNILSKLQKKSSMTFAEFMQIVLYDPNFGYYSLADNSIGKNGDFITAPEISSIFAKCLAQPCIETFNKTDANILEFGAGNGTLALNLLIYLKEQNNLPKNYFILEVSASLKAKQKKLLQKNMSEYFDNIIWLNSLPDKFNGIIIANEILDAMPVHRFCWQNNTITEEFICINNEKISSKYKQTNNNKLINLINELKLTSLTPYYSEVNLNIKPWLNSIANILQNGALLIIDYGFPQHEYYHQDRSMGTLMCHYQQKMHTNPFVNLGTQDITAHVDFTNVAVAATEVGLDVVAFTNQSAFLLNCGLLNYINNQKQKLSLQLLTSPNEMGELFKTMLLTSKNFGSLIGFQEYNQIHRL